MLSKFANFAKRNGVLIVASFSLSSATALAYALHLTVKRIENVLDPTAAYSHKQTQYIYLDHARSDEFIENRPWEEKKWETKNELPYLWHWYEKRFKGITWRLLEMIATADSDEEKRRTVKTLKSLTNMEDSDFQHLAQMCDSKTAVFLAREPGIDTRFFLMPPMRKECFDKSSLLNKFHDLFIELKKDSHHWCLAYFVSRLFRNSKFNYWLKDFEYLAFECVVSPIEITDENAVKLCVESLLHHVMIKDNMHAMVEARGLEILLDAHRFMPESFELKLLAVKILMKVSSEPKYLRDIHVTGWLKLLVEWSKECDQRLSSPAASALSNLERGPQMGSCYKSEVCLLHPLHREEATPEVDLIIVHGLLGSAHSTWKQRNSEMPTNLPLSGIVANEVDDASSVVESYCARSSSIINDMPRCILEKPADENDDEDDFEFVLADIPESASDCSPDDVYAVSGNDLRIRAMKSGCSIKSQCWPKDWLPTDFKNIKILGVDYSSRITDWTNWCPFRYSEEKAQLSERSKLIMEQLIECGVGERPIVWVGHSMGGLIIKHMLRHASEMETPEHEKFLKMSKSVFFLGTPHFGSPVASIRKYLAPLLPSVETKELEINSPELLNLHRRFCEVVRDFGLRVVTLIETKGAKLTVPPLEWELNCVAPTPSDVGTGVVYQIPVGHVDIAKLSTRLSFIYIKVLEAIKGAADPDNNGEDA